MDAKPRGFAVIINNHHFMDKDKNRTGTDKDCKRLKYIFKKMRFIVDVFDDLGASQMAEKMWEYSTKDHSAYDCFVCCILSHGTDGRQVEGVDCKNINIFDLTSPFITSFCHSLAGKPKLFFIQACQGSLESKGMVRDSSLHKQYNPPKQKRKPGKIIPDEADFFLGFATTYGHTAYRDEEDGSVYVNMLVDTLDEYADSHELLDIMRFVNREVGEQYIPTADGERTQIPEPSFTLRKKLFFK